MTLIRGLFAYPITPADADGLVNVRALQNLVGRAMDAGVDGVCVLGSTGTYPYLDRIQRRRAVAAAAEVIEGRVTLLAGVGALRASEAVALAKDAKAAGADAGLLAPVSYIPLADAEVEGLFAQVAGASGLPLCLYNNPAATHFTFSLELQARIAAIPGVIAVKNGAPPAAADAAAHLAALRATTPAGFSVGYAADPNIVEALIAGADAWHSVIAGVLPAIAVELFRAAYRGDDAAARGLNGRLEPLWAVMRELSGLRVAYAVAKLSGLADARPPLPILPLDAGGEARVAAALDAVLAAA